MRLAQQFAPASHALSRFFGRHRLVRAAAVTLGTALALHLVLLLLRPAMLFNPNWAVYWPLNAVLAAVLLMVPRSLWPPILLGAALHQAQAEFHDEHLPEMASDALANLLEVLLPALTLPPFRTLSAWMQEPRLLSRFIAFALVLAPVLSAIPEALAHHCIYGQNFWHHGAEWVLADSLGMALWLPLVLALRSRETYDLFRWRALPRTLLLLGFTGASSWFVFHQAVYPIGFVAMPALLLVALQLGFSGSVLAVNLLTVIVSEATLHGHGPFQLIPAAHANHRVATLQLFLALCMLMSLPISVLLLQRRNLEAQLRQALRRMETAATEDGLTGIPNRRRFDLAVQSEWARARRDGHPLGLLMIDVDHFKLFNDAQGHLAGDQCLRKVAQTLASAPHRPSDLLARYGGEEFAFLLPGANETGLHRVAGRLREEIESLHIPHPRAHAGIITVSIGAATLHPEPHTTPETLIHLADQALYSAKLQGRNRTHLHTEPELSVSSVS